MPKKEEPTRILSPFEQEIIEFWTQSDKPLRTLSRTGTWIRGHLKSVREDYCYRVWLEHESFIKSTRARGIKGLKTTDYNTFAIYWWLLKANDLILATRTEPSKIGKPRQYYRLNSKRVRDSLWEDIYQSP